MMRLIMESDMLPKSLYTEILNTYGIPNYANVPKHTLYHNTHLEYVGNIIHSGILLSKSKQLEYSGNMIWCTSTPNQKGYGGITIAFNATNLEYEQVNNDEFCVYENVPVSNILFIDLPVVSRDFQVYRLSDIPRLVDEYGEKSVINVCNKFPEQYIPITDVLLYI